MTGLYLIAAHMLGDFVLQSRWQALAKLTNPRARAQHCAVYALPFLPVIAWRGYHADLAAWRVVAFLVGLVVLHFLTDSRRFQSTLGDIVQWRLVERRREAQTAGLGDPGPWPPPNPWDVASMFVDQTLHVCQLAFLAGLFLTI